MTEEKGQEKPCGTQVARGRFQQFIVYDIQGVLILVCQPEMGGRDHKSMKISSKDPFLEMNRLASRRM